MCCDDPPQKRYWRLYYLLDLIPPATSKQVKWTFRKVTLRHHYYQAYLVLYNRSRKFFYDAVGEDAYGFIVSGTWGPIVPLLGSVATTLLYSIVMLIEIAMLLVFFAALGARVDDVISWEWLKVLIPLAVFAGVGWLCSLFALGASFFNPRTWREGMAAIDRVSPVGNFLAATAYACTPFVIGQAIRDDTHAIDGKCMQYMVMPIVGDCLYYLTSLIWRWPRRLRQQMETEESEGSGVVAWGIFLMGPLNMCCGIAQWVLIAQKIDGKLDRSWYVVFIPFCFRAGFRIIEACLRSLMKYYQRVRSPVMVAFDTIGSFFVNGILLISLYFVAVRIERGMEKCRMARALIPVYATLGYMFLAMIITMVYLLARYRSKTQEENRINNTWVPPQDDNPVFGGVVQPGSTSSATGPISGEVRKDGDWKDFDARSSPSSAAFPPDVHDGVRGSEPVDDDEEYDEFYSDEEEEVFPRNGQDLSPHTGDDRDSYDADPREPLSARDDNRDVEPRARSAAADPRTEPTPRSSRPSARGAAAPASRSSKRQHDRSSLTGDSDESRDSEYTYEYEDYTEQSGSRDEEDYEYSEYTEDSMTESSVFSSSFASSPNVSHR